jgi:hypothetical protein
VFCSSVLSASRLLTGIIVQKKVDPVRRRIIFHERINDKQRGTRMIMMGGR